MKQTVFAVITVASLFLGATSCSQQPSAKDQTTVPAEFTISKEKLMDKIKGGWAGQTIGCTYGGPTEFKYNGTMIQEYVPIVWPDGYIKWWYENVPGLYDDVYMDLTFVDVFDGWDWTLLWTHSPWRSLRRDIRYGMLTSRHVIIFCKGSCLRRPAIG